MKKATYNKIGGGKFTVEYDEKAPCIICGEPVGEASMGGTAICPACDCGKCRYCGMDILVFGEHVDGGRSLRKLREHIKWHKENPPIIVPINTSGGLNNSATMRKKGDVKGNWCD